MSKVAASITSHLGDTPLLPMSRKKNNYPSSRNWCFTDNKDTSYWTELPTGVKYVVMQKEKGKKTEHLHIQGYLQLQKKQRLSWLKKLRPGAHWSKARGSWSQNYNYCTKEESRVEKFIELGTPTTQGQRVDLDEFRDLVKSGKRKAELLETHIPIFAKYPRLYDTIRETVRPERKERKVGLFIGPPGTGKTKYAYDNFPDLYAVPVDKSFWFNAYDGQDTVLFDDYVGQYPLALMLRLLHPYPELVPIKGSYVWWNPSNIILTSNLPVEEWYDYSNRPVHLEALKRRIGLTVTFPIDESSSSSLSASLSESEPLTSTVTASLE